MSFDWIEHIGTHLPPSVRRAIKDASQTIHDIALRVHFAHWHFITTAPCNQDLELRSVDEEKVETLPFPCRQTNFGEWINADLGSRIQIEPVEWRVWQKGKSRQPHRSPAHIWDRSALLCINPTKD